MADIFDRIINNDPMRSFELAPGMEAGLDAHPKVIQDREKDIFDKVASKRPLETMPIQGRKKDIFDKIMSIQGRKKDIFDQITISTNPMGPFAPTPRMEAGLDPDSKATQKKDIFDKIVPERPLETISSKISEIKRQLETYHKPINQTSNLPTTNISVANKQKVTSLKTRIKDLEAIKTGESKYHPGKEATVGLPKSAFADALLREEIGIAMSKPEPLDIREANVKAILRERLNQEVGKLQSAIQSEADRKAWQEEAQRLKGNFLAKAARRWERGSTTVVGGGLHVMEELTKLATFGQYGDTLGEHAKMYHDVLSRPEMQPVVEDVFDRYLGGAVEMSPFLLTTLVPAAAPSAFSSIPVIANGLKALTYPSMFITAYGIESNSIYQTARNNNVPEEESRTRGIVGGLINAGIELAGGSGEKYIKKSIIDAATKKLGKAKYFTKKALKLALIEGMAEELPQETVSMIMGEDIPYLDDGTVDWNTITDRMIDTAVMATIAGGLVATPISAVETARLPKFTKDEAIRVTSESITIPGRTYAEANFRTSDAMSSNNPWIKQERSKTNSNRTLMVQFNSNLVTTEEDPLAKAYYDKLHTTRKGYTNFGDTREIPKWITEMAAIIPDSDVYFIRDLQEAKVFLKSSGYKKVAFSALDTNKNLIKELSKDFDGEVIVGGYVDGKTEFAELNNISWYDSMKEMAEAQGYAYTPEISLKHFEGSATIPRLCLSKGCKHKCAFCVVPKGLTEITDDVIDNQIDAIANLDASLVYLDDKTFGQAANHSVLPDLYWKLKKKNPEFDGFIIQTTASQFNKFSDEFLSNAHIKYVEIGVETFNDSILAELHKPATESLIQMSADRARRLKINLIPNIMIGFPQETEETYVKTATWVKENLDVISHLNIYNLALYNNTELAEKVKSDGGAQDLNENVVAKSFHENPEMHTAFAKTIFDLGAQALEKDIISNTGLTADQAIAKNYGLSPGQTDILFKEAEDRYRQLKLKATKDRTKSEREELAFLSRNRKNAEILLSDITGKKPVTALKLKRQTPDLTRPVKELKERGHGIASQLGLTEDDRRRIMVELTGKHSMNKMKPGEMETYVQYLELTLEDSGQIYEPKPSAFYELIDLLKNKKRPDRIVETETVKDSIQGLKQKTVTLGWEFARLNRFFQWLDGGVEYGWFTKTFWRPIVVASGIRNQATHTDIANFDTFLKSNDIDGPEWITKRTKINDTLKLTAFERIGALMLWFNPKGKQRLEQAGFAEQDISDIYKVCKSGEGKEIKVLDYLTTYYKNWWDVLKRTAISIGIDEDTLTQEILYSPIVYKKIDLAEQFNIVDYLENIIAVPKGAKPESKFLERREARVTGKTLELDAAVLFMNMVNRFNTFEHMAPVAYTLGNIIHEKEFSSSLNQATYGKGTDLITNWLKHSIRGYGDTTNNVAYKMLKSLRDANVLYAIGWNVMATIRQSLCAFNAMSVDPKMLVELPRALVNSVTGQYTEMEKFVVEKSPTTNFRNLDELFTRRWTVPEAKKLIKGKKSISDLSTAAMQWLDRRTAITSWVALYNTALSKGMNEKQAVEFADNWIGRTQTMADAVHLPDVMRTGMGAAAYKLIAPFTNDINQNLNLYSQDIAEQSLRRHISPQMAAYRATMAWVIPALVFGLIKRGRLQDDLKEVGIDMLVYPVAGLFLLGDWAISAIEKEGEFAAIFETGFQSLFNSVKNAMKGDIPSLMKNAARTMAQLGGAAFPGIRGAISSQSIRSIEGVYDIVTGETTDPRRLFYSEYVLDKYASEKEKKSKKIKKKQRHAVPQRKLRIRKAEK